MRLLIFDLTQGNRIGVQFIIHELGWIKGGRILAQLKWKEAFDNPFSEINKRVRPTAKQKLSQRQMAPLVILYQLLQKEDHTRAKALDICGRLSKEVAVAFLNYSIPQIRKAKWEGKSREIQIQMLNKIAGRFFNAESDKEIRSENAFALTVHTCHFAAYTRQLGVPELGPLFCESDKYYFENFQKEIDFDRSQTLAIDGRPCDFRFTWK